MKDDKYDHPTLEIIEQDDDDNTVANDDKIFDMREAADEDEQLRIPRAKFSMESMLNNHHHSHHNHQEHQDLLPQETSTQEFSIDYSYDENYEEYTDDDDDDEEYEDYDYYYNEINDEPQADSSVETVFTPPQQESELTNQRW